MQGASSGFIDRGGGSEGRVAEAAALLGGSELLQQGGGPQAELREGGSRRVLGSERALLGKWGAGSRGRAELSAPPQRPVPTLTAYL